VGQAPKGPGDLALLNDWAWSQARLVHGYATIREMPKPEAALTRRWSPVFVILNGSDQPRDRLPAVHLVDAQSRAVVRQVHQRGVHRGLGGQAHDLSRPGRRLAVSTFLARHPGGAGPISRIRLLALP
jgi:hypothetical protein